VQIAGSNGRRTNRATNKQTSRTKQQTRVCESLVSLRFCVCFFFCFFRSCWPLFLTQFRKAVSVIFVFFFLPFCTMLRCWLPLLVAIKQASAPHRQSGRNAESPTPAEDIAHQCNVQFACIAPWFPRFGARLYHRESLVVTHNQRYGMYGKSGWSSFKLNKSQRRN